MGRWEVPFVALELIEGVNRRSRKDKQGAPPARWGSESAVGSVEGRLRALLRQPMSIFVLQTNKYRMVQFALKSFGDTIDATSVVVNRSQSLGSDGKGRVVVRLFPFLPKRLTMKNLISLASVVASVSLISTASAGYAGTNFADSSFDLFDNGMGNLDITGVYVVNSDVDITFSVTTREFANWTKYMIFIDTADGGTGGNAWGRPVDLAGTSIDHFIGSWVDSSSNNSQFVSFAGDWNWGGAQTFSNYQSGNTVSWTVSLASLGLTGGSVVRFDVATSGGGNGDPGIDHLSRSDVASSGWGSGSVAGSFKSFTVVPAPGAVALLGLAGLISRRRR